jgi:DNA repair protein RadC
MGIKSWAEDDRPREKLILKGRQALSDAELIAILIGSGNREESAVALSQRLLQKFDHDLHRLSRSTLLDLQQLKGIGEAKAVTIAAALELGRRRQFAEVRTRTFVGSSADAFRYIAPFVSDLPHEEFWIILLNRANHIIGREQISIGGIAGTVVDPRIIFRHAVQQLATGIILIHNHPSGNKSPSQADIDITKKLRTAGNAIDIPVLDHLILAGDTYTSFADEGLL